MRSDSIIASWSKDKKIAREQPVSNLMIGSSIDH